MYINIDVLNITNGNTEMMDTEFGRMHIEKVEAGKLQLLTGRIIATDPILMYDDESFSKHVKSGTYPVNIYVGKTGDRKKQTVAAELKFSNNDIAKWEMALLKGESSKGFAHDEFMGYEVENGLGCFMDESVLEIMDVMSEEGLEKYNKYVMEEIRKSEYSCAEIGRASCRERV